MGLTARGANQPATRPTIYAQQVLGYSSLRYGLGTIALTLMAVVGSYAAQALLGKLGTRAVAAAAATLAGAGTVLLTGISADEQYFTDLFAGLALFGCGLGAATVVEGVRWSALAHFRWWCGGSPAETGLGVAVIVCD